MIYIFYTSIALAAIVSIGTIKAQMALYLEFDNVKNKKL